VSCPVFWTPTLKQPDLTTGRAWHQRDRPPDRQWINSSRAGALQRSATARPRPTSEPQRHGPHQADGGLAACLGPGRGDAVLRAFGDQTALEVRDGAEHMEDQLAGSRRRVDHLLQAKQREAALLQHRHDCQQLAQRPSQAVQAHHGQRVRPSCWSAPALAGAVWRPWRRGPWPQPAQGLRRPYSPLRHACTVHPVPGRTSATVLTWPRPPQQAG